MPRRRAQRPAASSTTVTPPVGGWDTRNALADMPEENAVILDNWFPGTDRVTVRNGYEEHATGLGDDVETLMLYTATDGSEELYGIAAGSIYDVTNAGAVGAAVVSGLGNSRFQHTQIETGAGHFLFAVNGVDAPRSYNGTTWTTASITGPTAANLIWTNLHQRRLWFGEKDSLRAWYLPVNSIGGTAASFDIGALCSRGGFIMAMGTWTRDSGAGSDDVAVFITSEGEAVVYAGTDPSTAADWQLVGVFRVGRPIGRRCMIKFGTDLLIVTADGFVPASQIFLTDRAQSGMVAVSDQINDAVNEAVQFYSGNFGWEPFVWPDGLQLIFNIPLSSTEVHQYVFNTITRKPCRFTGIPALCWQLLEDEPYFGAENGTVYKYGSATADDGNDITADALQAFSYFKTPNRSKFFKRVNPIFQSAQDPAPALDLNTDFQVAAFTGVSASIPNSAATWGVSLWGVGTWGSQNQIFEGWRSISGKGVSGSIRIRINTSTSQPSWIATRWSYINGGAL